MQDVRGTSGTEGRLSLLFENGSLPAIGEAQLIDIAEDRRLVTEVQSHLGAITARAATLHATAVCPGTPPCTSPGQR